MPYKIFGNCVHKVEADGSKGELIKCHESKDEALNHVRALWANVHDSAISEFSMAIVKTSSKDGKMSWRSVNSDIEEDVFGEKMSLELFADFNKHIENNEGIPEPFKSAICEEDWCGGMPYMSLSHFKSGPKRVNVPGEVSKVYIDGKALKSTGTLLDTPLGKAVYKSLEKDLTEKSANPVRISIGFLDLEHTHGDKFTFTRKSLSDKCPLCKEGIGDKIYKKGHLVHLALTRVPANPRTEMELEQKSMTTKLEDAKSIVEDDEVIKGLELKSQIAEQEVLVIKAEDKDEMEECEEGDEECMKKHKKDMKKEMSVAENTVVSTPVSESVVSPVVVASTTDPRGYQPVPDVAQPISPVEKAIVEFQNKIAVLKSQGLSGDAALTELQKNFDELGGVVKSEFIPAPSPEDVAKQNLEATLRSVLSEMLPQALAQTLAPTQAKTDAEIAELRALITSKSLPIKREEIPQPRSLNVNLVQKAAIENLISRTKPKDQFQAIADASVGIQ